MKKRDVNTLIRLATREADKIKIHATPEQINRLDKLNADPNKKEECIYGQMTGNCYSIAATQLIVACCNRVYSADEENLGANVKLNGKPELTATRKYKYSSPIEVLISRHTAYNLEDSRSTHQEDINNMRIVIDYIKGDLPDLSTINLSKITTK